jgi:hypothetical protein
VRVPLLTAGDAVQARACGDVHLAADDRFDLGLLARLVELQRAEHDAVIRERDRLLAEFLHIIDQRADAVRAVE